ncbi:MAG: XdhC/CoxI family protein [Bacillota bacterium]|nr:XdhC/CoxI family protein [Bacillota bacterium]
MREVVVELERLLRAGERVALATVIRTLGPTPRLAGARMGVRRCGQHLGTVGGGCGEAQVVSAGLGALDTGTPRLVRVDLTEEVTEESEAACGGTMDVLVPWGAELAPVVGAVRDATVARRSLWLLTCLGPQWVLGAMVVGQDEPLAWAGVDAESAKVVYRAVKGCPGSFLSARPGQVDVDVAGERWQVFVEEIEAGPLLLICGGGHIALPLCRMGKMLGFAVAVVDDRPSFASAERFPEADRVICSPFEQALEGFPVDGATYGVVVTRGHRHDLECAEVARARCHVSWHDRESPTGGRSAEAVARGGVARGPIAGARRAG